jgi:inner membrane protein
MWLIAGVFVILLQLIIPRFIIFWIGSSAILVSIITLSGHASSLMHQSAYFISLSFFQILTWKLLIENHIPFLAATSCNKTVLIGIEGIVMLECDAGVTGEVELYQSYKGIRRWKAFSDEKIKPGEIIIVAEARGIRLHVKKKDFTCT